MERHRPVVFRTFVTNVGATTDRTGFAGLVRWVSLVAITVAVLGLLGAVLIGLVATGFAVVGVMVASGIALTAYRRVVRLLSSTKPAEPSTEDDPVRPRIIIDVDPKR